MIPLLATGIFVVGYFFIALEHKIHINKAATALFTGIILWTVVVFNSDKTSILSDLGLHFEQIAEILFFLLGAMTIVELIDVHDGFQLVQNLVRIKSRKRLLWALSCITFLLSAVLDNMTTTIVMVALLKKIFERKNDQWYFAGFIIIAANAGGTWSPIGDVTTIMLWNAGYVSTIEIIKTVLLPSLICLMVPLTIVSLFSPKELRAALDKKENNSPEGHFESRFILIMGILSLLCVPLFKSVTHLPPFMGMLFGLSVLWVTTEIIHRKKSVETKARLSVTRTLQRIDTPSILFFLGILLAVSSLEVLGILKALGNSLEQELSSFYVSNILLGLLSAIVDNVPIVAGAMGMYSFEVYAPDHPFWSFLAYCVGTGGSTLIIGSAAGVSAMGLLNINFIWYLKRFSLLAMLGYLSGIVIYILQ